MTNEELIDKLVKGTEILRKCEDTKYIHCDFCGPKMSDGLYSRKAGTYEYPDEDSYCICGRCLLEYSARFPFSHGINLMMKIDEIQPTLPVLIP